MSDVTTSECECPRCGRPVEVEWGWSFVPSWAITPDSGEVVDEACGAGLRGVPRYTRRLACPTCGAPLEIDHELMPRFFAREVDND